MAIPTAATIATLAYLSARLRVPVDYELGSAIGRAIYQTRRREKQDRLNIFYSIEDNAQNEKIAGKAFLLYENRCYTFKQFYDVVLRYAGWLRSTHQVAQGEVVAINFMNCPEILILTAAIWSLGATPALINYNLLGASLIHSVRISSARVLIVEPEVAANIFTPETKEQFSSPTFRNNALSLKIVVLDHGLQTSIEHFKPYRAPDSARSGAIASTRSVLISTSGTTGLPKQATVTWIGVMAGGHAAFYNCGMRSVATKHPDIFYTAMPLYHGSAFIAGFSSSIASTCTLAIGRRLSISSFWSDVKRFEATIIQYVGESLRYLTSAPVSGDEKNHKVRLAFGNGLRPDVWKRFKARFGIETLVEFYGATDGVFALFNVNRNDFSDGAVGQSGKLLSLFLSRTLAVVKVDWEKEEPWRDPKTGFCIRMPPGQPGETIAKIDDTNIEAAFPGYHNNKPATEAKILRNVFVHGDAYFRTGDVMSWDSDGRFWFSDRMGDTYRWKSENVSTLQVGEIMGYHPEVLEANVYGVKVPKHEGRAGCVALLLKDSAFEDSSAGSLVKPDVLRSLAVYSRQSLQKASVPVFLRVVRQMLTTGNHKTIKHNLRNQGIDLRAIQEAESGDQLYFLKPGAERYTIFTQEYLAALNTGKARL